MSTRENIRLIARAPLSVMLGNYLLQTTSTDGIFRCHFFLALLGFIQCKKLERNIGSVKHIF